MIKMEDDGPPDIQHAQIDCDGIIIRESKVTRAEWRDPDDPLAHIRRSETPGGRGGAKTVHGYKRTWTIDLLHKTTPGDVTKKHVWAASRWLNDYELSMGCTPGARIRERVDGETESTLGSMDMRLRAADRFNEASDAVGRSGVMVLKLVIIDNMSLARVASVLGTSSHKASGRVCAALDRLVEHYNPPQVRVAQPPPDIVLERMGRWKIGT